jgi:PAS domain S-box-containing protein
MVDRRELQSERPGKTRKTSPTNNAHLLKFGPLGKSIFESLPIGVVSFGSDMKILEANGQAARLIDLGEKIDESLSKGTDGSGTQGPNWTEKLKSAMSRGETYRLDSVRYTRDGETKLLRITLAPLKKNEASENSGGTAIIEDITEKVNIEKQLVNTEKLATGFQGGSRAK